jgi:uncharacterized paraquat-inducible protein A
MVECRCEVPLLGPSGSATRTKCEVPDKSEKKFCSKCGERVSHSARRCSWCDHRLLTYRLVLTYVIIAVIIATAIFLVLVLNK